MNCLVTGGAGYIGSHVVLKLIEQGHEVDIIDNLSTGSNEALECLKVNGWHGEFLKSDIGDIHKVGNFIQTKQHDICFHFAGLTDANESIKKPIAYFENNVGQFPKFLSSLIFHNINKFVLSSSAAVYGNQTNCSCNLVTEKSTLNPANPYGTTKVILEEILKACSVANSDFKYTSLRYFNVIGNNLDKKIGDYGFEKKDGLIPKCMCAAAGYVSKIMIYGTDYKTKDGTCIRDYIHIDDLADAHIIMMDEDNIDNECYNIGNGVGYSVKEVVESFLKISGKDIPVEKRPRRPGDIEYMCADSSAFKNKTGWQPKVTDIDKMNMSAWNWVKKVKHIP